MSGHEKLVSLLPQVLPPDPTNALKAKELVPILRARGLSADELSDRSVASYITRLSKSPSSDVARRTPKQGYYLRPPIDSAAASADEAAMASPSRGSDASTSEGSARDEQSEEKFRSIYMAWLRSEQQNPVHLEHTAAARLPKGFLKWMFPDVISLEWDIDLDEGMALDPSMLQVRTTLGEQPFRLTSSELKLNASASTVRETFFQCLSNSKWAHDASLVFAYEISDQAVQDELQRLGDAFGVNINSFGLTRDDLAKLPNAKELNSKDFDEICLLLGKDSIEVKSIATAPLRETLDWAHLRYLHQQHPTIAEILSWIAFCIREKTALQFPEWKKCLGK